MNRFIINLRSIETSTADPLDPQSNQQVSTLGFRIPDSILGNMGQPLDYGADEMNGDDESASTDANGDVSVHGSGEEGVTNPGDLQGLFPGPSGYSGTT